MSTETAFLTSSSIVLILQQQQINAGSINMKQVRQVHDHEGLHRLEPEP